MGGARVRLEVRKTPGGLEAAVARRRLSLNLFYALQDLKR